MDGGGRRIGRRSDWFVLRIFKHALDTWTALKWNFFVDCHIMHYLLCTCHEYSAISLLYLHIINIPMHVICRATTDDNGRQRTTTDDVVDCRIEVDVRRRAVCERALPSHFLPSPAANRLPENQLGGLGALKASPVGSGRSSGRIRIFWLRTTKFVRITNPCRERCISRTPTDADKDRIWVILPQVSSHVLLNVHPVVMRRYYTVSLFHSFPVVRQVFDRDILRFSSNNFTNTGVVS